MKTQKRSKQLKQIETESQSGRSMVEMLGVLAIIAILSIGGIVGYKLAMNYYQANQIANEINIMHNDLKIKYALGNEELLLGDPYDETYDETYDKTPDDERYRGYLSTQYNRYPVNYDCTRKDMQDFYSCREADAYFIKVKNISKGVCKPLTTLLNAMNGLIYMEINKEVYEKDDLCTSDENNEFYIEFDAEDVNGNYDSNRPEGWCAKDEDCEEPQVCDEENNTCVECTENADCASNICRDNHTCGECASDSDCTNTETPKCNQSTNTCEPCPPEKPVWTGSQCVECITYNDCTDIDKPNCNTGTNTCEPCPEDQPWNGESCGCRDNGLCFKTLGNDYYCHKTKKSLLIDGETGACKKIDLPIHQKLSDGVEVWLSTNIVNYWNTCRLCEARAGKDGTHCSENSYQSPNMVDLDFFQCANKEKIAQTFQDNTKFWCHKTSADTTVYDENNVPDRVKEIDNLLTSTDWGPWLTDVSPELNKTLRMALYKDVYAPGSINYCTYGHDDDVASHHFPLCR